MSTAKVDVWLSVDNFIKFTNNETVETDHIHESGGLGPTAGSYKQAQRFIKVVVPLDEYEVKCTFPNGSSSCYFHIKRREV